jgi:hypothetical protein
MAGKIISSRPGSEAVDLELNSLSIAEIELISAYLWCTRMGRAVSPYRDAAYTLGLKIEALMGDGFMENSAINVDMVVDIIDSNGSVTRSVGQHFVEIDV